MECGNISANILNSCDYPIVGGSNDRLVLINKEDYDNGVITRNSTNNQIIEGIVLASGVDAFKYEGKNNSVEPRQALVKLRYGIVYDHEVTFKVFNVDSTTKEQLEKLALGKYVAIIQNNFKDENGKSAFEVYGEDVGLEVQELERTLADADTQGAFSIVLRTSDETKEPHLPATLFLTSFAITKAIVDGLIAA